MFERFTDKARRVVVLAQEESRLFNHGYIGTEHLLLGLIREGEGVGGQVLKVTDFDLGSVRAEVEQRVPPGADAPKGHIPFTPRAKKVLELSLRQAIRLGHDYIGTEHILLGIIEEGEGVAAQIVMSKTPLEVVRDEVMARLVEAGSVRDPEHARHHAGLRHAASLLAAQPQRDILVRLEAIEARLSAIEALLRAEGQEREAQ
jgi:ATP-dependent Clp protease ATP-binding subunit ClpA